MSIVDTLVLIYLALAFLKGTRRGAGDELFGAMAVGAVLVSGMGLTRWARDLLGGIAEAVPQLSGFWGLVFVVVGALVLLGLIRRRLRRYFEAREQTRRRRLRGGLAGALRGGLVVALVFALLALAPFEGVRESAAHGSRTGETVAFVLDTLGIHPFGREQAP
jgi:hypothetical protein